ncbi:MAG: B12-binding domain-containing protein [Armatimonadetes bacterium]|nr:B12-binding domain-containing protein [Armatimonadota bacterium]
MQSAPPSEGTGQIGCKIPDETYQQDEGEHGSPGLAEAVINGDRITAVKLTQEDMDSGVSACDLLQKGLIAGMEVVGREFKVSEFYVPEVLVAPKAMKGSMEILHPHLADAKIRGIAKVAIGTVRGNLHDIRKDPVAMMVEGAGFGVMDLVVVAMSALLTTTMPSMKNTLEVFRKAGMRDQVKVRIGGAPVTQDYEDSIGAERYTPDAASAVDAAKELVAA